MCGVHKYRSLVKHLLQMMHFHFDGVDKHFWHALAFVIKRLINCLGTLTEHFSSRTVLKHASQVGSGKLAGF